VDAQDDDGYTALMRAASRGHTATVEALIKDGAPVDAQDRLGSTALWWAAGTGRTATVETLITAGARVDAQDNNGCTALMRAAGRGDAATVEALIKAGAPVDAQDNNGSTALMEAAGRGDAATAGLKDLDPSVQRACSEAPSPMSGGTAAPMIQDAEMVEAVDENNLATLIGMMASGHPDTRSVAAQVLLELGEDVASVALDRALKERELLCEGVQLWLFRVDESFTNWQKAQQSECAVAGEAAQQVALAVESQTLAARVGFEAHAGAATDESTAFSVCKAVCSEFEGVMIERAFPGSINLLVSVTAMAQRAIDELSRRLPRLREPPTLLRFVAGAPERQEESLRTFRIYCYTENITYHDKVLLMKQVAVSEEKSEADGDVARGGLSVEVSENHMPAGWSLLNLEPGLLNLDSERFKRERWTHTKEFAIERERGSTRRAAAAVAEQPQCTVFVKGGAQFTILRPKLVYVSPAPTPAEASVSVEPSSSSGARGGASLSSARGSDRDTSGDSSTVYDIFISFRLAEAKDEAKVLKAALQSKGLKVFLCTDEFLTGDPLVDIVSTALATCRVGVLLATERYGAWTNGTFDTFVEMQFCLSKKKAFVINMLGPNEEWLEPATCTALPTYAWIAWPKGKTLPDKVVDGIVARLQRDAPSPSPTPPIRANHNSGPPRKRARR